MNAVLNVLLLLMVGVAILSVLDRFAHGYRARGINREDETQ